MAPSLVLSSFLRSIVCAAECTAYCDVPQELQSSTCFEIAESMTVTYEAQAKRQYVTGITAVAHSCLQ